MKCTPTRTLGVSPVSLHVPQPSLILGIHSCQKYLPGLNYMYVFV
jgi:hypothetical protein